jgi:hypothetical protein
MIAVFLMRLLPSAIPLHILTFVRASYCVHSFIPPVKYKSLIQDIRQREQTAAEVALGDPELMKAMNDMGARPCPKCFTIVTRIQEGDSKFHKDGQTDGACQTMVCRLNRFTNPYPRARPTQTAYNTHYLLLHALIRWSFSFVVL